jgi:hypothetical protein
MADTGEGSSVAARLVAQRADLLRGDHSTLSRHLDELAAIEAALADGRVAQADVAGLRREAERNRDILASAASGVRSALRRLRETQGVDAAYTRDGRRVALAPGRDEPGALI